MTVYSASPTIGTMMLAEHFVRLILGPVGSGKTTGVMFEVLRRCCEQLPGPDGFRRTRWVIVRNTLAQMKQTVLKDIESWLAPIAYYKSSENVIQIRFNDVISDWYLVPLDQPENQQRLLSLQLTGAWINEFIELDPELIPAIAGRCGRYPSAAMGGPSWFGIVGDSNFPNAGGLWHELLDITIPQDWAIFKQPGGLDPKAENLNYLTQNADTLKLPLDHPDRLAQGRKYYERLSRNPSTSWVKRYVHAQFGDDPDGTAVFRETFNLNFHVFSEGEGLIPSEGHMLIIGQDFGRNPCALITQMDHRGRWLILDEVVSENMGLEQHLETRLKPLMMSNRYFGKPHVVVGDPAGKAKSELYEENCFDLLKKKGYNAFPAPTNSIDPRLRAVESMMLRQVQGKAMMLVDGTRCPTVVRALHTKYLFGKTKLGETKPLPMKTHPWSDVMDALQYAALCADGGYHAAMVREMTRKSRRAARLFNLGEPVTAGEYAESSFARAGHRDAGWT